MPIALRPKNFILKDDLKWIERKYFSYYQHDSYYLIITGEGIQKTTEKLGLFLGLFGENVERIINFGVVGALIKNCKKGEIVQVRTVYRFWEKKMQFNSFEASYLSSEIRKLDLITCQRRVLNDENFKYLACFGELVDREAWGIFSIAKRCKIDVFSLKVISDFPKQEQKNICELVKSQAQYFSKKLYLCYGNLNLKKEKMEILSNDFKEFYMTEAQKNLFEKLKKSLQIKFGTSWKDKILIKNYFCKGKKV